jgi:serine/threonine protein kinase
MTPAKQIFFELSDLPREEREARLEARCGGDAGLRERVRALLDGDDFGQQHAAGPTVEVSDENAATAEADRQIGPYRILQQIGEGGFAKVYLAEQDVPVRRRVALKILKPGMDKVHVVARFDAERQALAMMQHPNVAKVFDAGMTGRGRPFFAMEYVPGESITTFCDRQQYTTRQRLELFCQACAAVQHAHQKAIIHRDLKPSNILVTLEDHAPRAKVIDFGVAKAVGQPLTEQTLYTYAGELIGTPEYMSPEQADTNPLDIDTRSDIYSLGIVLYELLCGTVPFDPAILRTAGVSGIQRIIREVEPPRPSTKLGSLGERAHDVARSRQTQLAALEKELHSELEWIPLKAMRKERDRRYGSAAQLAEDIHNYLQKRPLLAGPESKLYRLRKFARRNRSPIAAVSALGVALLLGAVTTGIMYVRSERQRLETLRQSEIAQSRFNDVRQLANRFLFDVHDKIANLAGSTPARASLVQTALEYLQKLSSQAGDDPDLLREIFAAYIRVGDVQGNPYGANLGDNQGALASYRKALHIARQLANADPTSGRAQRDLAQSHQRIGDVLFAVKDTSAALESHREAMGIVQKLAGANPADARAQRDLAVCYNRTGDVLAASADRSGALECFQKSLAIVQKLAEADPKNTRAQRDLSVGHERIGDMLSADGDTSGALDQYRKGMDIAQKLADDDPGNAKVQRSLSVRHSRIAAMLTANGDANGALESYRKSLAIAQKLADADPTNADAQRDLLVCFNKMGRGFEQLASDTGKSARERIELWEHARTWYLREQGQAELMTQRKLLSPADAKWVEGMQGSPARCDAAIAELAAAATRAATEPWGQRAR